MAKKKKKAKWAIRRKPDPTQTALSAIERIIGGKLTEKGKPKPER